MTCLYQHLKQTTIFMSLCNPLYDSLIKSSNNQIFIYKYKCIVLAKSVNEWRYIIPSKAARQMKSGWSFMLKALVTLACKHLATNWRLKFQQPTCDKLGFICIKSLIGECLGNVGQTIASIYQFYLILRRIFAKYSHNIR